jgi:hypothetical protein
VPPRPFTAGAARRAGAAFSGYGYGDIGACAIAGHPRGEALRDLFNRRGLSFDRHGFLLGYEKTHPISGRKKPPQKGLRFSLVLPE